jgi:hypothetical protein
MLNLSVPELMHKKERDRGIYRGKGDTGKETEVRRRRERYKGER